MYVVNSSLFTIQTVVRYGKNLFADKWGTFNPTYLRNNYFEFHLFQSLSAANLPSHDGHFSA